MEYRFVNNSFTRQYVPTSNVHEYNVLLDLNEEDSENPYLVDCEIVDTFPLNHPLLLKDALEDVQLQKDVKLLSELTLKEMERKLRKILNNEMWKNPEERK